MNNNQNQRGEILLGVIAILFILFLAVLTFLYLKLFV